MSRIGYVFLLVFITGVFAGCNGDGTGGAAGDLAMSLPVDAAMTGDLASPSDLATAPDLASTPDLARAPDLAMMANTCPMHALPGATCTDVGTWIMEWVSCNRPCSSDADCVKISVHDGTTCKNPCPVVTGQSAQGAYLQALEAAFTGMSCGHAGCNCLNVGTPVCKAGLCTAM